MKTILVIMVFLMSLLFYTVASTEMIVTTKDNRTFKLPISSSEVKRIEYTDGTPTGRYKAVLVPEGITWEEANKAAQAMGGHLATITSAAENDYVYSLVANDDRFWYKYGTDLIGLGPWLGGYQPPGSPEPSGGWRWVTGEPFTYSNWASGQPDNYRGEDYLHYWGAGTPKGSKWNDCCYWGKG